MAKSHSELEKKLGTAPEEYDFSKSKFIDPDYVPFQELKQMAKDKRVPKDVIDKMLDSVDKYFDEFSTNVDDEIKKIGDNANERIVTLNNWAKANLSKDSYEALSANLTTAETFKALEELRGKIMSSTPQVPGNNGDVSNNPSLDDVKMELSTNLQKYKTDEAYRKDLTRRLEIAAKGATGYIDKNGA